MKEKTNRKFQAQNCDALIVQGLQRSYTLKAPILSAYFLYLEEERWKALRDQSNLAMHEIVKQAYTNWHQNLTNEQRDVYQEKAKQIKNESDAKEYMKMLEQSYTIKKKITKPKEKPKPKGRK
ncbi:unnamed protein product [Paramecium octaurelia]|uniref:HMG box domain-containing protein n=1 Tax=Paramecium octaurelia TaxID=43137 RepID=A0A8S1SUZ0_PAROT|nr:unnamed protein product [Paramecium octaurelia]CAD8142418.1 unnamed protein product [Paramecium octaurelia]